MKILVADDTKTNLVFLSNSLQDLGHDVIEANSGEQAIEHYTRSKPDLVILDVLMEGIDGFECARRIRNIDPDDWIPIIFLSADVNDTSIARGIDAGGDDYLTKPFSAITLSAKIKAMQRISDMRKKLFELTQKLRVLSTTDPLTGLYNRLQFDTTLKEKIAEAIRHNSKVALLFIDLDRFKPVNDTKGHAIGDLLLKHVASRLKTCLRINDFVARLGGDEFAIIISWFENDEIIGQIASKIVNVLNQPFIIEATEVQIGASIGVAIYPTSANSIESLLRNADAAMYQVKGSGKNRFAFYQNT